MQGNIRTIVTAGLAAALGLLTAQAALADQQDKNVRFPYQLTPGYDENGNVVTGVDAIEMMIGGRNKAGKGPDLHSQNMHLLASAPQTLAVNSDLSFWGDLAYVGNYDGFR